MSAEKTNHKAEALSLIQWAVGDDPGPALNQAGPAVFTALQLALIYSNLAIAEGQERVAEELRAIKESLAFGMRDEIHQALSEIVVAVKEGVGNA